MKKKTELETPEVTEGAQDEIKTNTEESETIENTTDKGEVIMLVEFIPDKTPDTDENGNVVNDYNPRKGVILVRSLNNEFEYSDSGLNLAQLLNKANSAVVTSNTGFSRASFLYNEDLVTIMTRSINEDTVGKVKDLINSKIKYYTDLRSDPLFVDSESKAQSIDLVIRILQKIVSEMS